MKIHFDMETSDPDDVMTLAILATHPNAEVVGVTLTPGGRDQYDLVREVLRRLGRNDIPVGSADPERTKPSVSNFHYHWIGNIPTSTEKIPHAHAVLEGVVRKYPEATLLTGGPLKNPGHYPMSLPFFERWVGQGGFAGDPIVPPLFRLKKFNGRRTCPTFNFNGDPQAATHMLGDFRIKERYLASKNVCHGIGWDQKFHEKVKALSKRTEGLDFVLDGMRKYLENKPTGKLLHDPVALALAIDPSVAVLAPVKVYQERGEWGSRYPSPFEEPDAKITVCLDHERFFEVLTRG